MAYEGYVYEESTAGATMDVSLATGNGVGGNILQQKQLEYIYYDINTHGKDVTLTVYIDDVAQTPVFTLNTDGREQGRIEDIPEQWAGYTYSVTVGCTDLTDDDLEIYSPLILKYVSFGV